MSLSKGDDPKRIVGKILVFSMLNVLFFGLILALFGTPFKDTVLSITKSFLTRSQGLDSWMPMLKTFRYFCLNPHRDLYEEIFFEQNIKFQYPLTSLLIFSPFLPILGVPPENIIHTKWLSMLRVLSWVFMPVSYYFIYRIFQKSLNSFEQINLSSKTDKILIGVAIVLISITFYPHIKAYELGQIQSWLNCLFSISLLSWMNGRKRVSGVLLALMTLVKPQYGAVLIWAFLRKQWNFIAAFLPTLLLGIFASILAFGWVNNLTYLKVVSFISRHGESYYPNQSFNGLINRLLLNGNIDIWSTSFPDFNIWVYVGTVVSSLVLFAFALYTPPRSASDHPVVSSYREAIDFSIIILTSTMASPVAWEHHYGVLLPMYALIAPMVLRKQIQHSKMLVWCLGLSYVLTSNYFWIALKLSYLDFNLNVLQSYLFFGALIFLTILYVLRRSYNLRHETS